MTKPTEPDDPKQSSDSASEGGGERSGGKSGFRPSPTPRLASAPLTPAGGSAEPAKGAKVAGPPDAGSGSGAKPDTETTGGTDEPSGTDEPAGGTDEPAGDTAADERPTAVSSPSSGASEDTPPDASQDGASSEGSSEDGAPSEKGASKQHDLVERDLDDPAEAGERSSEPGGSSANAEDPEATATAAAAERAEPTVANGQTAAPALPPPWNRVPAVQPDAGAASSGARTPASSVSAPQAARSRATTGPVSSPMPSNAQGPRSEPVADVRAEPRSRPSPAPRPPEQPADDRPGDDRPRDDRRSDDRPREGRTVADEARAAGFDQPTTKLRSPYPQPEPERPRPAPGGFPMSWPRGRQPRQANLQLKRLDPWSVLKIALVLAVVLYLIWLVAVGVLYGVLDGIGVWDRLNGQYTDLVAEQGGERLITAGRVFGVAAVVGAVNSLLVAVSLSVGAFIYNVSSDLVGGLELTLSERD